MHQIKPIAQLSRDERRELAHAAAERGDQIQQACPFAAGTPEYTDFENDFIEHRRALLPACA